MKLKYLVYGIITSLLLCGCATDSSETSGTSSTGSSATNGTSSNSTSSSGGSSSSAHTQYTIEFDLNGGTSASYIGSRIVEVFSKDAFFFDCVKDGLNFRGWSYNGTKIFDENGNQLANPEMASAMTFVAQYANTAKMTIATNMPGAGTIAGEAEYPYNTYVDVSAHPNAGYEFVGWYYQGTLLSNTEDYKYMMWDKDVTLEARFKLDTFTLNIESNNSAHGLVLVKSSDYNDYKSSYSVDIDYTTQTTIAAYSKTDVRFLGWYDDDNKLVSTNAVYTFTMPNHDYDLEAKWNYFTVTYNLNGGEQNANNPASYTIDDDALPLAALSKTGYTFLGWKYNGEFVTSINPNWIDNITLDAIWEATTYSITYNLNGGTNSPWNPATYNIESNTITLRAPSRAGYTFDGWYKNSFFKVTSIPKGSYGDVNLYAKWTVVIYSITYNLDGGTNASSNPKTYTVEDTITLSAPSKTGYTFEGWYNGSTKVDEISKGTTGNISITAKWSANKNNLSVTSEDTSKGRVAITSGTGYSYESITVTATPIDDCVFKGWYNGTTKVSDDATYTFTMPTNDYSLVAHFFTKGEEEERKKNLGIIPVIDTNNGTLTYGLYPQTHVNDADTISALNKLKTKESNGWYLYNGEYYAKKTANPYNDSPYTFDDGTTIESTLYWFKCEPIEWKVLASNDGTYSLVSSLLLAGYLSNSNNYAISDIRESLNGDFLNTAFNLDSSLIQTTTVDNSKSTTDSSSNRYTCDNTEDKIYLLSYKDYLNADYGFSTSVESTTTRECKTTDYVRASEIECSTTYNGRYLTRSPFSGDENSMWHVGFRGELFYDVYFTYSFVRPALTIKL